MSGMSLCPAFRVCLRSLRHQFFGTIAMMEFVLKNLCQQLCSFSLAPCPRSYMHVPWARVWKLWQVLCAQFFGAIDYWWNLSWKTRANSSAFLVSLPANEAMHVLSPNVCKPLENSWAHSFSGQSHWWNSPQAISHGFPSVHPFAASISLLPNGALPKLFPTVSPPSTLSSLPYRSLTASASKREPKHWRCFWEKDMHHVQTHVPPNSNIGCYLVSHIMIFNFSILQDIRI